MARESKDLLAKEYMFPLPLDKSSPSVVNYPSFPVPSQSDPILTEPEGVVSTLSFGSLQKEVMVGINPDDVFIDTLSGHPLDTPNIAALPFLII